jgi:hypothetical protein
MSNILGRLLWAVLPVGAIAAAGGCMSEGEGMSESGIGDDSLVATATIENNLAADGCTYLVTIDDVEYAPDAASFIDLKDNHVRNRETVKVSYRSTGRIGEAECGFGSIAHRPEIHLTVLPRPVEPDDGIGN